MTDRHICTRGKIWDLHIHSNQCFSCTDPDLKSLSASEYVEKLFEVFSAYEDLDMISFTDHNQISIDLYRAFYAAKSRIALLPGIEIDVSLEPNGISKHLVVYFDAMGDMDKLEKLANRLNAYLSERNVGSGNGKLPVDIHSLLEELVGLNVHFALSPHALKQAKRGIDYDWHALPYEERDIEMKKFLDQFFCFWESSGESAIAHAVDFLKQMSRDELVSVVAFSDSKDFTKLRAYLENPCQYFNALPNFNGLKLAGSDISRITRTQNRIEDIDLGSYIGCVNYPNQSIELSPRLNAIIGGRGSGKSVLLDSIATTIRPSLSDRLQGDRRNFIDSRKPIVTTMSGSPIVPGQFSLDYFNQSYIASLFSKTGDDFNKEIESYFSEPFSKVKKIDVDGIKRENASRFDALCEAFETQTPENIVGFIEKYVIDTKDELDMAIGERKSKIKISDKKLASLDYSKMVETIHGAVLKALPTTVSEDQEVLEALVRFEETACRRAHEYRLNYLEHTYLQNKFAEIFLGKKASISEAQKIRKQQIDLFVSTFSQKSLGIRKRVSLVRSLLSMCEGFIPHVENHDFARGERENAFKFVRELKIEHPIDFMVRTINECVKAIPGFGVCTRKNLWNYLNQFCFSEDGYRKDSDWENLYDKLKAFDIEYKEESSIQFGFGDGVYRDIRTLSPGTQTNILIEYIVHKDTNVPLLIDQPEDNVDNQTIYSKIRAWFMDLKMSRQVIVVTHDANIVINADAENVIIAEQPAPGEFIYDYGALEYDDVIDKASLILDGGKDAVKRRLVKYGE